MKRSLKVGVYSTFLLGIINIIFDTIRFATIKASAIDTQISISTIGIFSFFAAPFNNILRHFER